MTRQNPDRLAAVQQLQLPRTGDQHLFDAFVASLANCLQTPIALFNLLERDRDFFVARVGVPVEESPAAGSFCERFFKTDDQILVAEDALKDPRFRRNPYVLGAPHIRFYVGARLEVSGQTVGTLCAYDLEPRKLSNEQFNTLRRLSRELVETLEAAHG